MFKECKEKKCKSDKFQDFYKKINQSSLLLCKRRALSVLLKFTFHAYMRFARCMSRALQELDFRIISHSLIREFRVSDVIRVDIRIENEVH